MLFKPLIKKFTRDLNTKYVVFKFYGLDWFEPCFVSLNLEAGTNLVRIRLWHNPIWTNYSNINDVKKSIQRAKSRNAKQHGGFFYS